jgi:hypothetical protein
VEARSMRRGFSVSFATLALACLVPSGARAAWPSNPLTNLPICTATNTQAYPAIAIDGSKGAIIVWEDYRGGTGSSTGIYAEHVLTSGSLDGAWPAQGRALTNITSNQTTPAVVGDGAGGAIVTWKDLRGGVSWDIYAQHVMANGSIDAAWPAGGRALCVAVNDQLSPMLVSDGLGGAIVTWEDHRGGSATSDIYAQHVQANGVIDPLWPVDGVAVCTAPDYQYDPKLVSDGGNGAIITWWDHRNGNYDVYAQHMLANGTATWIANGLQMCSLPNDQVRPTIVTDGASGAIVAWEDYNRSGTLDFPDVYAQHVLSNGTLDPAWPVDGTALSMAADDQVSLTGVADGAGGAIITWQDDRSGNWDVYAQHVLSGGGVDPLWPVDGRGLSTDPSDQQYPRCTPDGAGGVLVAWIDYRNGSGTPDIYAGHILAGGGVDPAWPVNGRALCTAANDQSAVGIVPDGNGGAIVTWMDYRSGNNYDIYAQEVDKNGLLGGSAVGVSPEQPIAFRLDPVAPNPWRSGALAVQFGLVGSGSASFELLDVAGRRWAVQDVSAFGAGRHQVDFSVSRTLTPGLYLLRLREGSNVRVARVSVIR